MKIVILCVYIVSVSAAFGENCEKRFLKGEIIFPGRYVKLLPQTLRRAWPYYGVPEARSETLFDHIGKLEHAARLYFKRVAPFMINDAILMARVHDFPEVITTDIIPADNVPASIKYALEYQALDKIALEMNRDHRKLAMKLWHEYNSKETMLSKSVGDLDKIEAGLQAMAYTLQGYDLHFIATNVRSLLKTAKLQKLYDRIYADFVDGYLSNPYETYYKLLSQVPQ